MGFGTLFIGYFLLLNITNYPVSDALAGLVMLLGLVRLAGVNRRFALARWATLAFTVFGFSELVLYLCDIFGFIGGFYDAAFAYFAVARSVILAINSVLMLTGMEDISREVGLDRIPTRCRVLAYSSLAVYALWIVLDMPLGSWMPDAVRSGLYISAILLIILLHILSLATIYGCYMRICMPGEENGKPQKPSRFKFVNAYRERQAEKEREAEEYRREQLRKQAEKRRTRKK